MVTTRLSFPLSRSFFSIPSFLKTPFLVCLLIGSLIMLLVLVAVFTVQPVVPLFYSLALPAQHLAPTQWLFLFPSLSFGITFIHVILINRSLAYNRLILELFAWTTVGIQVVLLLALVRIIWIVS